VPEVVGGAQAVGGQHPDLDEVLEVPKAVEVSEPLDRVGRKGQPVAPSDSHEGVGLDGPLQVDVELDLG
jgi:hypothetical protein